MALNADKSFSERDGDYVALEVKEGETIFSGSLVCLKNGLAIAAKTATNLTAVGVAVEHIDASDSGQFVNVKKGIFLFMNSSGNDEITAADIGKDCYVVDDETVAKTDGDTGGGATRSVAGKVFDVEENGVWVDLR